MRSFYWQTAHRFGKFCRNFSKNQETWFSFLGESIVGEIERRKNCPALCAGNFLLGAQELVKLTLGDLK